MTELDSMGAHVSAEIKTDDVTQQVIDLDARIATATASLDRIKLLLDKATALPDSVLFDVEVARRQTDLETLRGQQRTLNERTDLATIVLTLVATMPGSVATGTARATGTNAATQPTDKAARLPGFGDGLAAGWKAFTDAGWWRSRWSAPSFRS